MNKYIVAIIGFLDCGEALSAINEMMNREGIWLFTIAGSGSGVSKEIADKLGCPYQYCKSIKELEYQCNYFIIKISNQEIRNFAMKIKNNGKHGIIRR